MRRFGPLPLGWPKRRRSLLRAVESNPDAFAAFYEHHAQAVFRFLARRALDPEVALDLASETFAQALTHLDQYRGSTPEEDAAWLYAIARSQLSAYWRRGQVEHRAIQQLGLPSPSMSLAELERMEELIDLAEMRPLLAGAMAELPVEQEEAVRLRVVAELDYATIARQVGASEEAVRARVSRGLRRLGQELHASGHLEEAA